ncbi:MAG TPA: hypothetical protein H9884_07095 [Candidatus Yaniella excrementigallinarum]|nr:hypothetical protein [Candidatus Yaniella excrementigallinarum]
MARSLTESERQLVSAMIVSAKATNPDCFQDQDTWYRWRQELHETLDRITVGEACDCGKCPSVQLLVDGQEVPLGDRQVILEAFISEGIVMLFIDDDLPSYLEIAPNLDVELELPKQSALIF